jgi:uncharacterized protein (DUF1778 family)
MPIKQTGGARMDFRLSEELKKLIEQAALLSGQNLSDFATGVLARQAEEIVERHRIIRTSQDQYDQFVAFLEAPAVRIPAVSVALAQRELRKERQAERPSELQAVAG